MTDTYEATPTDILVEAIAETLIEVGGYKDGAEATLRAIQLLDGISAGDTDEIAEFQRLIVQAEGATNFLNTYDEDRDTGSVRFVAEGAYPKPDLGDGVTDDAVVFIDGDKDEIEAELTPFQQQLEDELTATADELLVLARSLGVPDSKSIPGIQKALNDSLTGFAPELAAIFAQERADIARADANDNFTVNPFGGFARVG